MDKTQLAKLESFEQRIKDLTASNEERLERVRNTIDEKLKHLQENNEKKLDQMRQTVDEKLHDTLEKRLGDSFKIVSDRLEQVHHGQSPGLQRLGQAGTDDKDRPHRIDRRNG